MARTRPDVLGTVLLGGAVALAQPAPKPESGPAPDRRQAMMQRMCAEMPAMLAGRLAYAEVKIGITDQQKGAWQTFAQEARAAPDAVTQLVEREKMLTAMLETTRGMRAAVEKLTPSLTDEQKKQVAEIVARIGRGPWSGGMRGHRMMHHHGHGPGGDTNAPMRPAGSAPSR
jgi:hypothetical protein